MDDWNELMNTGAELVKIMSYLVSLLPFIAGLIAAYIIEMKLLKRINFLWDKAKKREKAKSRGQIVTGYIKSREREYLGNEDSCLAKYVYEINGIKRTKVVDFGKSVGRGVTQYPKTIAIYYLGMRIYTDYENGSIIDGLLVLPMFFSATCVAVSLQCLIYLTPLLAMLPELSEYMHIFKNGGLIIIAFFVISIILCKVNDVRRKNT